MGIESDSPPVIVLRSERSDSVHGESHTIGAYLDEPPTKAKFEIIRRHGTIAVKGVVLALEASHSDPGSLTVEEIHNNLQVHPKSPVRRIDADILEEDGSNPSELLRGFIVDALRRGPR